MLIRMAKVRWRVSEVAMDSTSKHHLGISAAPVPLLIRGAQFERLADTIQAGGSLLLGPVNLRERE